MVRGRRDGLLRIRADWEEIESPSTVDAAWGGMSSFETERCAESHVKRETNGRVEEDGTFFQHSSASNS